MTDKRMAGTVSEALGYFVTDNLIREIRVEDFGQMRTRGQQSDVERLRIERNAAVSAAEAMVKQLRD